MPEAKRHDPRARRWRERLALLATLLFPLLVGGGFLAPGFVRFVAVAQEGASAAARPSSRIGFFDRQPLLVPRDFSAGFVPELLDLDQLFVASASQGSTDATLARVAAFPRSHTDSIILDDVGSHVEEIAFKDILMDDHHGEKFEDDKYADLLPLCGTLHASNCFNHDDLHQHGHREIDCVPEPGTGALLALGLVLLAGRRRRA